MHSIFNYITVISSAITILLILLQARGASVGAGFGGSADIETSRRGSDKTLFQMTIVTATVFVLSIILGIIAK
jgi:preprotein translocase subunit SecG